MNPHAHNEIHFAGLLPAGAHAQDGNRRSAAPAAPANMSCPKCGSRAYPARWHGQVHLRCADRQCGFHLPWEAVEEDRGLNDLKPAPANPIESSHLDSAHQVTCAPANFLPDIETVSRNKSRRISKLHETMSSISASNQKTNKVSTSEQQSSNNTRIEHHA